jgi:dihydroxyacetone kinase
VSIDVRLNRVHVPGQPIEDVSDRTLGADEVGLGMGIHNEPGSGRVAKQLNYQHWLRRCYTKYSMSTTKKDTF